MTLVKLRHAARAIILDDDDRILLCRFAFPHPIVPAKNKVVWAQKWTKKQIARGRAQEARAKERYYDETQPPVAGAETLSASPLARTKPKESLWEKIKNLFS